MDISQTGFKLSIARFLSSIIGFLSLIYFAQKLGASKLGTYFLFQTAVAILSLCSDLGIKGAIEKRISEGDDQSIFLSTGFVLHLLLLLIISAIVIVFRGNIDVFLGTELTLFLIIALFTRAGFKLTIRTLNGELRVGETATLLTLRRVIWAGGGVALLQFDFGVYALVYSLIISYLVVFLISFNRKQTTFGKISSSHARSLYNYSKYHFISISGSRIYSWMDVAIIGFVLTQTHVGVYESAWRVTGFVMLVSGAIANTIFPQISKWNAEDDTEKIEELIPNGITWSLVFVVPAFFGAFLLSEEILLYLFGGEFTIAAVALIILLADKVVGAVQEVVGRSLSAIDHPELSARAALVSVGLNIILNVALIYEFGIIGAAAATFISSSIGDVMHGVYLSRFIDLRLPIKRAAWMVFASTVMVLILYAITNTVAPVTSIYRLLLIVGTGAIIYSAILVVYRPFRAQIHNFLRATL